MSRRVLPRPNQCELSTRQFNMQRCNWAFATVSGTLISMAAMSVGASQNVVPNTKAALVAAVSAGGPDCAMQESSLIELFPDAAPDAVEKGVAATKDDFLCENLLMGLRN